MNSFSSKDRSALINKIAQTEFDVIVIGGGITGAGIALDATSRGLKVALLEMQDFASGTSGRSTKLIHGGLRYLKQLELRLVAEVGKERETVHRNAPHLTKPEPMLLPIVKGGSLNKISARIAMYVYELIAGVKKKEKHRYLTKEETILAEPSLKNNDLLGGILFYEYRTDDARLTIEILKEAVGRGAIAINYFEVTAFNYQSGKINGLNAVNKITGETFEVTGRYIINAGGPWVDTIDDLDSKKNKHKLQITKGVHLVADWEKLPVKQAAYFDTFDKRMLFVIPRDGKTYIGTTDTFYKGDISKPGITNEDRDYILKCVNEYFPHNILTKGDIESGWSGLRPLVTKPGKKPSEISRKDEIFEYPSGLITIAGGKLTGYRKMAQRTVDLVAKKLLINEGKKISSCSTRDIPVSGGKLNANVTFADFLTAKVAQGKKLGLSATDAELLTWRYGSNVEQLYEIVSSLNKKTNSALPLALEAQLIYCIENEMCFTPADFLIRRTSSLYFDIDTVRKWAEPITNEMKKILSWNEQLTEQLQNELNAAITEAENIKK